MHYLRSHPVTAVTPGSMCRRVSLTLSRYLQCCLSKSTDHATCVSQERAEGCLSSERQTYLGRNHVFPTADNSCCFLLMCSRRPPTVQRGPGLTWEVVN